ncbi:MAG: alpha/beta hydrolase [Fibrella sp.]|nr:alpha/beta hydrolase [Armatimonadota bacterium]
MRPLLRLTSCTLALCAVSLSVIPAHAQKVSPTKPAAKAALAGTYSGKLVISPTASLTIVFHVRGTADKPTATMDVPEQGGNGIPVSETVVKGNAIIFRLKNLGATFTGTRSADGKTITGTFTQGGQSLPLTLTRTTKKTVVVRPQTPKPPFPYRTEEVSYTNPKAEKVTIAGTLSVPTGAGPFPVVLFITGSGPQDRDETIMEHKPFAVIADYLARRGIASLRVDDRGVGKSIGDLAKATSADFAEDTRAGVAFLKGRSEVNPKQIGLIGHSEGGLIAPMVAANNPDVAFIVILAGTGVPGKEVVLEQQKAIVKAMGAPEAALAENQRFSKAVIAILETEKDPAEAKKQVKAFIAKEVMPVPVAQRDAVTQQLENGFLPWCEPWFTYFILSDPTPVLQSVSCPVLALNGSLDLQVLPKQNLGPLEAALKKGNNKDVTVQELPGLNHLFQHAKTGSPMEYATITESFAPEALTIIGDWITARTTVATP